MKKRHFVKLLTCAFLCTSCGSLVFAQEAASGFDLRATATGQWAASSELTDAPRSGAPVVEGFRSIVYPTWKINDNWFVNGSFQLATRPYYFEEFSTRGYGAKGTLLQAALNYARVSDKGAVIVRAGVLPTTFGSFMLRYDDADNPLVDMPIEYGYYYSPITMLGVTGAQVEATRGKLDGRVQFANSSPANPKNLFARDQYGNWAGGAGYTIRQGFRVGVSAYRGPYLSRNYRYFFPGEENPNRLPAHAFGADLSWVHGHTTVQGEFQKFVMPYSVIPTYRETAGYGEVRQVLTPRWYVALRNGYTSAKFPGNIQNVEAVAGFRPNRFEILKVSYEVEHYSSGSEDNTNILAIQLVTTLHKAFGRE